MSCKPFQDALIEAVASGEEPLGELRAHLKDCGACRAAFEQEQTLFAGIDSGLRSVANAEVPPSLLPRVRAALDEATAATSSWSPKWFVLAGASAMLAFFFVTQTLWRTRLEPKPVETASNKAQPSAPAKLPQKENPSAKTVVNSNSVARGLHAASERITSRHGSSRLENQTEILVPRDQEVLLASYAEEWRHGRPGPTVIADADVSTLKPLEVAPIQIAEVDVKLLAESE